MPKIKSLARSSEKWARQSQTAQPEYKAGVEQTTKDWAENTAAAADNYAAGVQKAIAEDRFSKGVAAAGTSKWRSNTLTKGPARWSQGIADSRPAYETGFAPYRTVIENTTLPPRGPKGSPQNIERVAVMAAALHKAKLEQQV